MENGLYVVGRARKDLGLNTFYLVMAWARVRRLSVQKPTSNFSITLSLPNNHYRSGDLPPKNLHLIPVYHENLDLQDNEERDSTEVWYRFLQWITRQVLHCCQWDCSKLSFCLSLKAASMGQRYLENILCLIELLKCALNGKLKAS